MLVAETGRMYIRYINGGYSPKVDDREWTRIKRDTMEELFGDSNIVGDGHFRWAQQHLEHPAFFAPLPNPRGGGDESEDDENSDHADDDAMDVDEVPTKLTQMQKKDNKNLRAVRGGVESPFGLLKREWKTLGGVWLDTEEEQRQFVFIAAAILNMQQ